MTYSTILVHVQTHPDAQRRLACACALANRFDATLLGVGAEMVAPYAVTTGVGYIPPPWYSSLVDEVNQTLDKAHEQFKAATRDLHRQPIWRGGVEYALDAITRTARAADLIVASPITRGHEDQTWDAPCGDLVVQSGRPVLIAPAQAQPLWGTKVLVAWKDTREARRALADAMPFFHRAEEVRVVEVCHGSEATDAKARVDDVVAALARHGVQAHGAAVSHQVSPAKAILAEADGFGADLIVAGGYGHSRLGEMIFGGVTRELLSQQEKYVLVSH